MSNKHFERQNIAKLAGYVPGEQPIAAPVIKLNTNESPYPTSPKVQDAIAKFSIESLRRYPQPTCRSFSIDRGGGSSGRARKCDCHPRRR